MLTAASDAAATLLRCHCLRLMMSLRTRFATLDAAIRRCCCCYAAFATHAADASRRHDTSIRRHAMRYAASATRCLSTCHDATPRLRLRYAALPMLCRLYAARCRFYAMNH